jgi:hypothetical protein
VQACQGTHTHPGSEHRAPGGASNSASEVFLGWEQVSSLCVTSLFFS